MMAIETDSATASAPPIFRAPMRSHRDDVPAGDAVERALRIGVCGLGGVLHPAPATIDDAVARAAVRLGDRVARRIVRFAEAPDGALVWTRDVDGLFWLGRVSGPWRYDTDPAAEQVDLTHVRACDWTRSPVPDDAVPAAVRATFARGGRNWQRIAAGGAAAYTESTMLWRARTGRHP